jgi:hypothetical protein
MTLYHTLKCQLISVTQYFSNCGLQWFAWWSAGSFRRKIIAEIVSDTEQMKNTPIHVSAKTAFVG